MSKMHIGAPPPPGTSVLWRIQAQYYSVVIDAEAERYATSDPEMTLVWYPIVKQTPCGVWIDGPRGRKFVNMQREKKWACLSVEEAVKSFCLRTSRHIDILQKRINRLENELQQVKQFQVQKWVNEGINAIFAKS